jgi:hypothetical protein
MDAGGSGLATRHPLDGRDHDFLAVVQPLSLEGVKGLPAKLLGHGQNLTLPDASRPHHGQIVTAPLLGYTDTHLAQTDDVRDVPVILLDPDRRKDEGPLFVHVPGVTHIGGGLGIAAIGLMRLHPDREVVHVLLVYHRNQNGMVGGVGAPVVG